MAENQEIVCLNKNVESNDFVITEEENASSP